MEAARAMAQGIENADHDAEVRCLPMADGGEGTARALVDATGGSMRAVPVHDPLGRPVEGHFGLLADGTTAVVETAEASGLALLEAKERNPLIASSYGTGELMLAAVRSGAKRIIVGLGGSATNDAGAGLLQALGVRLLDKNGNDLAHGGAALANLTTIDISTMDPALKNVAITAACDEVIQGKLDGHFPLVVWQTGSGTQTNMNVNEVIAHLAGDRGVKLHPNDQVNASQSSNDTFPSALHIAAALSVTEQVLPAAERLAAAFRRLEEAYPDLIRIGRTHLQDATPLKFAQEVSGWRELVEAPCRMLRTALPELEKLAIGGTAVGTGLNAPKGYDEMVCRRLREMTGVDFTPDPNKFHALTSKDALVFAHGALKALAANLMKIANDIRFEASGPRCGMGSSTSRRTSPAAPSCPAR